MCVNDLSVLPTPAISFIDYCNLWMAAAGESPECIVILGELALLLLFCHAILLVDLHSVTIVQRNVVEP